MNSVRNVVFSNVIKHDPQPEDAGTIKINAKIFGGDVNLMTFTTTSFIEEFIDEENDDCPSKQDVNYFLMEARLNSDVIWDAMYKLILFVDEVTYGVSNEDLQRSSWEVDMDILLYDDDDLQINQEAVQASFNQTSNIRFRPASTICLEEFNNGTRVATLSCGHEFDDKCMTKWF